MKEINKAKVKPIVLVFCNYYLPGYKAGGGLRTVVNTVELFKDRFDFKIVTFDHDGDGVPYSSVKINEWNLIEGAEVYYLSKNNIKFNVVRRLISEVIPDIIYLNSVFSILTVYSLLLKRLNLIKKTPIVLAPEGELSDGALRLKASKKKTFISFAKKIGLYKNLIWKVTAEPERIEAGRFRGRGGQMFIAPNLPSKTIYDNRHSDIKTPKIIGEVKMVFLSRFARKKNFKWLIDNLKTSHGKLQIDVYGPLEDENYWDETQLAISNLEANIKVNYQGEVIYEDVPKILSEYHFFVLPTLGENFGHVFIEALAAGCPLLISDTTPWVNLEEKGIGWDLPLQNPDKWNEIIEYCIDLDDKNYRLLSNNARQYAVEWLTDPQIEQATLSVLQYALEISA